MAINLLANKSDALIYNHLDNHHNSIVLLLTVLRLKFSRTFESLATAC